SLLGPAISLSIPLVETSASPAFRCNSLVVNLRYWSTCSGAKGASYPRAFSRRSSTASTRSWNQMLFRCTCTTCGASWKRPEPARAMVADSAGQPRLDLPSKLAAAYAAAPEDDLFAIRDTNGRLIAASPAEFGDRVSKWPPATDEPSFFRLSGAGSEDFGSENYYGLSIALPTAAGPMWISVARTEGSDAIIRSILREFVFNALWVSP